MNVLFYTLSALALALCVAGASTVGLPKVQAVLKPLALFALTLQWTTLLVGIATMAAEPSRCHRNIDCQCGADCQCETCFCTPDLPQPPAPSP